MIIKQTASPKLLFLKTFLAKPLRIGSITPSSKHLAREMVKALNIQPDEIVVELGPGTGVFTTELLRQNVKPENIVLVEFNTEFADYLRKAFPKVTVIEGDASTLPHLLANINISKVRHIISGIPMRSLPPHVRIAITEAIADALEVGGIVVQFTYALVPPLPTISTQTGKLEGSRIGMVLKNLPPAYIWRYVKT
jgi:phosphatidylethanolamine/phosphatidyl-N-methylethanolamine N-methyltransferase